jgi:hypothetical protein
MLWACTLADRKVESERQNMLMSVLNSLPNTIDDLPVATRTNGGFGGNCGVASTGN